MRILLEVQMEKRLPHFSLHIEFSVSNEIVVLFGPSGSGKTTILNSIAGLVQPDAGIIKLRDRIFYEENKKGLPPQERNIGYLFQDYALFPHMTVEKNIAYGQKQPKNSQQDLTELLGIGHLSKKYPHQISGGEKQRVALARALATEPSLLLLDEPLSALDQDTRQQCQEELIKLHQMWKIPFLMVTHDQSEAERLGHRILYIEQGKLLKDVRLKEV